MVDYNIQVKIDPAGARTGGRAVRKELSGIDRAAQNVRKSLLGLFAGTALIVGLRSSIRLLASYGQEMSTVRAITGATENQFQLLNEQAKELGVTTRFSASEAASGMTFLARAGFSVQEVYDTLPSALQLAQVGNLELARSADIASNVLKGFRLNTEESGRVVDVLAKAANSSNTSVEQLGQALSFVAPVAAGLNINLEETTAAIGALSDAGIQSTRAGTGLRRVLAELESPGTRAREIFRALQVDIESVRPSSVGLSSALRILAESGLTAGQALEIFGQRGGPAFAVLASSIPSIESLNEKLENAEGSAERMALIMDDNLNGALLALKSAVEGTIVELGDAGLTGAIKSAIAVLTEFFRFLATNADIILSVFTSLVFVIGTKYALQAVPLAIAATQRLTFAIAKNPIGFLATVLTTAIVLLVQFADKIKLGGDGLTTLADYAVATFEVIREGINFLVDAYASFFEKLPNFLQDALKIVENVFNSIQNAFRNFIPLVARVLDIWVGINFAARNAAIALWNGLLPAVADASILVANKTIELVESLIQKIVRGLNELIELAERVQKFVLPEKLEREFEGIGEVTLDRLDNEYAGAGKRLGENLSQGIIEGLQFSGVSDAVVSIAETARERARLREEANAIDDSDETTSLTTTPTENDGDLQQFIIDSERKVLIDDVTNSIIKQTESLKLRGDERERYLTVLDLEEQIAERLRSSDLELTEKQILMISKLTDAERARVEVLTQERLEQERRAMILDGLNETLENYIQRQTALNQLLSEGIITQRQYNIELANTPLVRDFQSLDGDLGGQFALGVERDQIQTQYDERQELLENALEAKLISEQEYAVRSIAIEEDRQKQLRDLLVAQQSLALTSASATFEGLADIAETFAGDQSGIYKALFTVSKAFAIADSIIKIQQGIANALSLPFPANIGAAATVAAQAASIVANIQAVSLKFAEGGYVDGPGTATSDSILARLSKGEYVVNAKSTSEYLPLLEAINADKYASGGRVGRTPAQSLNRSFGEVSQTTTNVTMGDINIEVNGTNVEDGQRAGQMAAREFEMGVMKVLQKQMRSGGKLERVNA